jgi:kynurenine formamidase
MSTETWEPDSTSFPSFKDLPSIPGAPDKAAWFWGKDDYLGRLNLLTPTRVKAAAAEIKTGEIARMDLPLDVPKQPAFGRETFQHQIKILRENVAYDDTYFMNTQSGTQWDGFRHAAHASEVFYNGAKGTDFLGPNANLKCSIHYWSEHGFAGRGVLLDYRSWATANGIKYDSASSHPITYEELVKVGKHQGIDIRPASKGGDIQIGDILFIRSGWKEDYNSRTAEENNAIGLRVFGESGEGIQRWTGVKQEPEAISWLHDCYFAAVGGDTPTFELWPTPADHNNRLHGYLLALWGMPLGEMVDLERVAELAKKNKKYTFFFTSAPANVVGGVSSHVNGTAIF